MQGLSDEIDVVVIGAGPAGLFAAYELGKQSIDTVVLEEHPKIGVPTSCAGLISVSGFTRLGIRLPASVILNRVRGAIIYSPSGRSIKVERSTPQAYVVDRARFDQWLAKRTEKVGIRIHVGTRATKIRFLNEAKAQGVEVLFTEFGGRSQSKLLAKICIDAEGCMSRILRQTRLSPPPRHEILPAVQYEYKDIPDLDPTLVEMYMGQKIAPGFFAWMIPTGKDSARVGLACKSLHSPRRHLEHLIRNSPLLRSRLRSAYRFGKLGGRVSISGPIKKTYTANFLAIGDAAGQIKPTTGGGVVVGGLCAQLAGRTTTTAIQLGQHNAKVLSTYQRRWKSLLGKEFLAMKWFRSFFNSLNDPEIDWLFKKLASRSIISLIEEVGDMDLQAKVISSGLTHISLLDFFSFLPKVALSLFRSL